MADTILKLDLKFTKKSSNNEFIIQDDTSADSGGEVSILGYDNLIFPFVTLGAGVALGAAWAAMEACASIALGDRGKLKKRRRIPRL